MMDMVMGTTDGDFSGSDHNEDGSLGAHPRKGLDFAFKEGQDVRVHTREVRGRDSDSDDKPWWQKNSRENADPVQEHSPIAPAPASSTTRWASDNNEVLAIPNATLLEPEPSAKEPSVNGKASRSKGLPRKPVNSFVAEWGEESEFRAESLQDDEPSFVSKHAQPIRAPEISKSLFSEGVRPVLKSCCHPLFCT
jgi:hypothetical protein